RGNVATNWDGIYVAENADGDLDDLDHFAHPSFICCKRKSLLGQTIIARLMGCEKGHSVLIVCHAPGKGTRILGILHNSVTITDGGEQAPIAFGVDQKAAAVVIDLGVYYGILPSDASLQQELLIAFQLYRDKKARKHDRCFDSSVNGYWNAMISAMTGGISQEEALALCEKASHPFCPDVVPLKYPRIPTDAAA
ncbi:MAG: hypothetical protein Greene041662_836, partial [Candidatus Peregrinibacteria bacterium Greene0416_62]